MKLKLTLAAVVLAVTPGLALACGAKRHDTSASLCPPAQEWNAATATCVAKPGV